VAGEYSREHEQQIRESVEIASRERAERRLGALEAGGEGPYAAFGTPHDGARHVAGGRSGAATWQDEIFEWRQRIVEAVELALESIDLRFTDQLHARDAQLSAQIEQVVLHAGQALAHCRGRPGTASTKAMVLFASSTVP